MAPDNASPSPPSPEGADPALAREVRQLKQLLMDLQADLKPALGASLQERSQELQRLGGELSQRQDEALVLRRELDAARARCAELELEVERWQGAARRGVDEIADKARAAAERHERETAELIQAVAAARAQLESSRAQAAALTQARDAALTDVERRKARIRVLKAKVVRREVRRIELMRSPSWRITAPIRWFPKAVHSLLLGGARLRRRLLRR